MVSRRRFIIASVCSILVHSLILAIGSRLPIAPLSLTLSEAPVLININPTAEIPGLREIPQVSEVPRRLVDAIAPTSQPIQPTDLIAAQNTQAQDMSDSNGPENAPDVDTVDDHEISASPTTTESSPPETASPPPSEGPASPGPASQGPVTGEPASEPPPIPSTKPMASAPLSPPSSQSAAMQPSIQGSEPDEQAPKPSEQPFQLAKAQSPVMPIPAAPPMSLGRTMGRIDGGVKTHGIAGFEARKDEIAPYLDEIRKRVGKLWRSNIQMKYSGSAPTKAVVDCEIGADGRIARVEIAEPGTSPTYAPLCKDAIEQAGPFPPFPFEVPDVYRNRNLEIRWTFSFMTR